MNNYEEYLLSPAWRERANRRIAIDGYRCAMCGCEGTQFNALQVHHFTYRNIGHEDVDRDLVTLCDVCHRRVHKMMARITDSSTGRRGWKDELPQVVQRHVVHLCMNQYETLTSM